MLFLGMDGPELENPNPLKKPGGSAQTQMEEPSNSASKVNALSSAEVIEAKTNEIQRERGHIQTSKLIVGSETKQAKGALPEGFFDDKDADLRARGITPVKLDVK